MGGFGGKKISLSRPCALCALESRLRGAATEDRKMRLAMRRKCNGHFVNTFENCYKVKSSPLPHLAVHICREAVHFGKRIIGIPQ